MPKRVADRYGSINPPIYNSTAFGFNSVNEGKEAFNEYGSRFAYGRMGNPSLWPFELWFAEFHGVRSGSVWATHNGMNTVVLSVLGSVSVDLGRGKKVVASPYLYGGTHHLLEFFHRNGWINLVWVKNPFDISAWKEALGGDIAACALLETPANPTVDIFDIEAISEAVCEHGSRLIVDDTLGVGLQEPLELGADCLIYSATKALNRKSSHLGGAVVAAPQFRKEVESVFDDVFVHTGLVMSAESAVAIYGNRTKLVRDMQLFSENALSVATFLENHSAIQKVNYPQLASSPHHSLAQKQMPMGVGGLLSFELQNFEAAVRFVESQEVAILAVHLGDGNECLVTHPASTTHSKLSHAELLKLNITPELVRMSVSLGDMEPVIKDFERALDSL